MIYPGYFFGCLQSERSDKLQVTQTGTGGLAELREALSDSKASYAYARVAYSNDKQSTREKFVLVVWIGPGCKIMRKAKVRSSHVASFQIFVSITFVGVTLYQRIEYGRQPPCRAPSCSDPLSLFRFQCMRRT
jgi:hypothetical protein